MTTTNQDKTLQRPDWLTPEVWPHKLRSTEVEGAAVAYTDEGAGPVMLLVHDGMWSYVWGQLISQLSDRFRVVTLDFPGSGLSPSDDKPPSLEGDSQLLEGFVDRLRLPRHTLVLHDLGGSVGLGYAGRRPEMVDGLVLMNTFAWPAHTPLLRGMFRLMTSPPVRALNVATNLVPRLTTGQAGIGRSLDDGERRAFLGGFIDRGPRRRFHDLMGAARREIDYLEQVEQHLQSTLHAKPALTIFGEKNDPFGFQARFGGYLEDVEEMVVTDGNHFPMADDPNGVAERIAHWHYRRVAGS